MIMMIKNEKNEWNKGKRRIWTNPGCRGENIKLSQTSDTFILRHILTYPITDVLSLIHGEGTFCKTHWATNTKALENRLNVVITGAHLLCMEATVIDGGRIVHENILHYKPSIRNRGSGPFGEGSFQRRINSVSIWQVSVLIHYIRVCDGKFCGGGVRYHWTRSGTTSVGGGATEGWCHQRRVRPFPHARIEKSTVEVDLLEQNCTFRTVKNI